MLASKTLLVITLVYATVQEHEFLTSLGNFFKFLQEIIVKCNNYKDEACSFYALLSTGRFGRVETLTFQAWVSMPPSGSSRC